MLIVLGIVLVCSFERGSDHPYQQSSSSPSETTTKAQQKASPSTSFWFQKEATNIQRSGVFLTLETVAQINVPKWPPW